MKKIKSIQDWLPIEEFLDDGILKLKNKKYVKIIKIIPINYNLKSDFEKKAILNSYKIFLKTCNFNIQILIQSNKEDLNQHILNIQKNIQIEKNKYLREISEKYIDYIKEINLKNKSSSKNFYLIISSEKEVENIELINSNFKEMFFKIKECLNRCGNSVLEIKDKEELINIFYSFFNTRKNLNINN